MLKYVSVIGVVIAIAVSIWYAGTLNGKNSEIEKEEVKTAIIVNDEVEKLNATEEVNTNLDSLSPLSVCKRLFPDDHKGCERQQQIVSDLEGVEDARYGSSRDSIASPEEQLRESNMAYQENPREVSDFRTIEEIIEDLDFLGDGAPCSDCVSPQYNDINSYNGQMR